MGIGESLRWSGTSSILVVELRFSTLSGQSGAGLANFEPANLVSFCGDGIVDPGEECDEGGESSACDTDCTIAFCGDGTTNTTLGEECDDGNDIDGDGCSAFCLVGTGESVEESVGPGGTVSTADGGLSATSVGDDATSDDVVDTSVTTPNAGTIKIVEGLITSTSTVTALKFLGEEVRITAPNATAGDPLILVFALDATIIPTGEDQDGIAVFRDGVDVPACTGTPGTADPDPCVSARLLQDAGDVVITILTSAASQFDFGGPGCPPAPAGACNQDGLNITVVADKKNKPKLSFKWLKGAGLGESAEDFGDPTDKDSIMLCLYAAGELEFEMRAPPKGVWKKVLKKGLNTGFAYSDKALSNSGIKKVLLKGGSAGKAKVMVLGKGPSLPIPDVTEGLDPSSAYNVQVQSTNQNCWGMSYGGGLATNRNGLFKLKRQGP
jgi:cysteine-rich repeat protein